MAKEIKYSKEEIISTSVVSAGAFLDKILKKYKDKDGSFFITSFLLSFVDLVNDHYKDSILKLEVK